MNTGQAHNSCPTARTNSVVPVFHSSVFSGVRSIPSCSQFLQACLSLLEAIRAHVRKLTQCETVHKFLIFREHASRFQSPIWITTLVEGLK